METDELVKKVIRWGRDKSLNDPKAQLNKVTEEVGEIAHEVAGARPMGCLEIAYREIRDRKGKTENGTFVKEERDGK